ncbi:MAG: small ribosomal subunit biogenesis GTPase RsgA [Porticoccaceae bacterium]|nr:small ribosomal subunit biogenesis GTPase RsgA [Porticoccaceae bacterium]
MSKRKLTKQQKARIQSNQDSAGAPTSTSQNSHSQTHAASLGPETVGRVISNFGSQLDIEALEGTQSGNLYRCHKRANVDTLVTGDHVVWRAAEPYGVVIARKPRTSELVRPDIYGKIRPVAANIDRIAIVFACAPTPYSNLIDRYLVAAEAQGIQPVLIANKIDQLNHANSPKVKVLMANYAKIGYPILPVSAESGEGISALQEYLCDRTCIFVGQSGVGKSSLINHLQPRANAATAALSVRRDKGVHTTTASRLFHLQGGGKLIDSPGIREFSLSHLESHRVIEGFIDFHPYLGRCKFRDCRHRNEPDCALLEAVDRRSVLRDRLDNYHQIINSQH